ncbi:MAG: 4-(cytidine 5'-diphospho)-2-C-methyl-D-erythritol kinase [Clostridiales bacterium]|nr:4-(cytidine 5'-diphospho)-2-C-methyl-D-erythritol kinase [Clostridiales bacterium]
MITATARGKINWLLRVVGRNEQRYHLLNMVLQSISIHDTLFFSLDSDLSLTTENMSLQSGEQVSDNLIFQTAELLKKTFSVSQGANIHLVKGIPSGAGMGGGSADAAATFLALNTLWNLNLSLSQMKKLGLTLGADIPFCIEGGLQHVQGIGEKLTSYCPVPTYYLVVLQPERALSTKEVFHRYAQHFPQITNPPISYEKQLLSALQEEDFPVISAQMANDLQSTSSLLCPDIPLALEALLAHGALQAVMTGSGSAVFGLFSSKKQAEDAYRLLCLSWKKCFYCETCSSGVVLT